MKNLVPTLVVLFAVGTFTVRAQEAPTGNLATGIEIGEFMAESRTFYTTRDGLPADDTAAVAVLKDSVFAGTAHGLAQFQQGAWSAVAGIEGSVRLIGPSGDGLVVLAGDAVFRVAAEGVVPVASLPDNILHENLHDLAGESPLWLATGQGLFSAEGNQFEPVDELNRLLGNDRDVRQVALASDGRVARRRLDRTGLCPGILHDAGALFYSYPGLTPKPGQHDAFYSVLDIYHNDARVNYPRGL